MSQVIDDYFTTRTFKLNGRGIGLTYSNVAQQLLRRTYHGELDVDSMRGALLNHLRYLEPHPVKVMVSMEHHRDGSVHFHAMCQWLGREVEVDHRHFDYEGCHPNIQQLRNPHAWDRYLRKEDQEPLEWVLTIALDDDDLGYITPPEE